MKSFTLWILASCFVFSWVAVNASSTTATEKKTYKIRWLLAHEPIRVFERAAKQFKNEVELASNGQIQVEILNTSEYIKKYSPDKKYISYDYLDDVTLIKDNKIEMTQTYTTELGRYHSKMWVLDLPFLFRNHDHAKKIIDGKIGQEILAGLTKENIKGLSFTYSGGYRVLSTKEKPITKVEDFQDMKVRISRSPVTKAMYDLLGAQSLSLTHKQGIAKVKEGRINAAETTIARFDKEQQAATPIISDTQHSLFLTSMVVNNSFYSKLPAEYQEIIRSAAKKAAETERLDSLSDESSLRKQFAQNHVKVVSLSETELNKMKTITRPLYQKFEPMFGADLIKSIENTK